ncbi:translation initiation factor IF-2 [Brevundimonas sp.]|uniref:translation initiation factor IF-2 n=1 Tax=Brevundimonas sp. TaxID=1871086 RepID=UPI003D0F4591
MRLLSSVAAVATLALTTPAFAAGQTPAPQAAPAPATAPAPAEEADSPEEAAFEAKGEAFGEKMETMSDEMQAAAVQADKAKAKTDLDAIQARYQPEVDAFADEFQAFIVGQGGPADQIAVAAQRIKSVPAMVRTQAEQAAAAPAAATPAQPQ